MPTILFTQPNDAEIEASAGVGKTLLQAAEAHGVDGLLAECGGSCSCGTCHCYIDPAQLSLLAVPEKAELEMLDFVADERKPNSRLACQVKIVAELDGLRVQMPARQI